MLSSPSRRRATIGAYFLDEHGIPFRLVNPFTLKRRWESEDINRRKNDFRDAEIAAELLHIGKFIRTRLPYGVYAQLRATYNTYRCLVKERARYVNLLKGLLDGLFLEFTQVFKNPCGKTALTMPSLCPVPKVISEMKLEDFVVSVRKEFQGRTPRVQKLHANPLNCMDLHWYRFSSGICLRRAFIFGAKDSPKCGASGEARGCSGKAGEFHRRL